MNQETKNRDKRLGSIPLLFAYHGIFRRDMHKWRIVKENVLGEVNGLPQSHGRLVATNGVLCLIEVGTTDQLFEGHLEWFKPYNPLHSVVVKELLNPEVQAAQNKARTKKTAAMYLALCDYVVDEKEQIIVTQKIEAPI